MPPLENAYIAQGRKVGNVGNICLSCRWVIARLSSIMAYTVTKMGSRSKPDTYHITKVLISLEFSTNPCHSFSPGCRVRYCYERNNENRHLKFIIELTPCRANGMAVKIDGFLPQNKILQSELGTHQRRPN